MDAMCNPAHAAMSACQVSIRFWVSLLFSRDIWCWEWEDNLRGVCQVLPWDVRDRDRCKFPINLH